MSAIFISYRRSTDRHIAGRLRDQLIRHFDVEDLFRDRESIQAGDNWRAVLDSSISSAKVCLVVIGPEWASVKDDQGQLRLFQSTDWVRYEIETALAAPDLEVIPVLVEEATLPKEQALPPTIMGLLVPKAKRLSEDDWDSDCQQLIKRIQDLTGLTKMRKRMTTALTVIGVGVIFGLVVAAIELSSGNEIAIDTHLGYLAIMAAGALVLAGRSFLVEPQRHKLKTITGIFGVMAILGVAAIASAFAIWQGQYAAGLLDTIVGIAILTAGGRFLLDARRITKGK
ncbi:MAG: toll/interleukin-1 receptor domain-containing protein [Actinomycetota bacterium]